MKSIFFCTLICITFAFRNAYSQDSTLTFGINIQGTLSTPATPLWFHSNTNGTMPTKGSFVLSQFGLFKKYNPNNPRFIQWSAGAEVVTYTGISNNLFFSELYAAAKFGPVELSFGQRKEFMGLGDSLLSSGPTAMSSNFRPYPKIQLYTPRFVNIIPGNDIASFKLSYSDGILGAGSIQYGNVSEVPQVYLHQKSVYLRLGGDRFKLNLYAGFNHQAMWGGEDEIFSGGLKRPVAYKYVIFGKPWARSRVGNHFGTIDLAAELKTSTGNFLLYRQSIYEDGSLITFSNVADGLNGIRFKRKITDPLDHSFKINTALLEFIYTKNQGGAIFDFEGGIFGNDNYFNHYVYKQGWSYKGRALGTPLIASQTLMRDDLPRDPSGFTVNNRIIAIHSALNATWGGYNILFKGTYSKNFGSYNVPFDNPVNQASFLLYFEKPVSIWKKSIVSVSLASDIGKLYPNNSAISLGWKKSGFIR
ncbi:capsule assembly Wzi family protein [Dyadobacter psychrotolerans]|uniref:Capsule assembly Wzi family protein n=1 Tax=Dyadobacter psychrotolerans TaxID=2541721 RepID=A0A4V2Z2E7_9BACT|nr:capsule assembly Wzi family protein [Dyadobacter psychrotolerans]TDE08548.1 hypothetical protein E0F88_32495 [Dyadobacter psychrotolerans]